MREGCLRSTHSGSIQGAKKVFLLFSQICVATDSAPPKPKKGRSGCLRIFWPLFPSKKESFPSSFKAHRGRTNVAPHGEEVCQLSSSQLKHSTGCISNTRRSRGKRRTSLPKKRSLDGEALFPLSKPPSEKKLFPRKLSPPLHSVVGGPRKAGERPMSKNGEKQEGFFPSLLGGLGPESLTPRRPTQPTN